MNRLMKIFFKDFVNLQIKNLDAKYSRWGIKNIHIMRFHVFLIVCKSKMPNYLNANEGNKTANTIITSAPTFINRFPSF